MELVDTILRSLKISGIHDKRWFSKDDLPLDTLSAWLPLLEPYYLPCKAARYLHGEMTKSRIITVMRHVLKQNGILFNSQERVVNGSKMTLYQVFYKYADSLVTFN